MFVRNEKHGGAGAGAGAGEGAGTGEGVGKDGVSICFIKE